MKSKTDTLEDIRKHRKEQSEDYADCLSSVARAERLI